MSLEKYKTRFSSANYSFKETPRLPQNSKIVLWYAYTYRYCMESEDHNVILAGKFYKLCQTISNYYS